MPSRSGSTTPVSLRKKVVLPTEYQDTVPAEFEEKIKQPKPVAQSSSQDSRPQTPLSEHSRKEFTPRPSPKLTRASSKVFEKVRGLEERRRSLDLPEGSVSGRSWAGFNRAGSVDSDDGGSRLGISRESSREDLREALKEDAAERRSMFRQRAASLEEKPHYSQKVQDIENKFTEELQRIKKLVGKPHLKKSFSTEQLTLKGKQRQPLRKIEPIPLQVLQKLQARERAQSAKEQREKEQSRQPMQEQQAGKDQAQFQLYKTPTTGSTTVTVSRFGEVAGTPESMQLSDLPGQRSARELSRVSPVTEITQRSSPAFCHQQRGDSPSKNVADMTLRKVDRRPASPLVQRISRIPESQHIQESPYSLQNNETAGRKTPIEVTVRKIENRPESPLVQKRSITVQDPSPQPPQKPTTQKPTRVSPNTPTEEKMEVEPSRAASNFKIPAIIVEDEKMEEDAQISEPQLIATSNKEEQQQSRRKEKRRRSRPLSPELGEICFYHSNLSEKAAVFATMLVFCVDSSDDSYVSAGEDPMEAPVFEFPLQDTVVSAGAEAILKCIIAGTPNPEGPFTLRLTKSM